MIEDEEASPGADVIYDADEMLGLLHQCPFWVLVCRAGDPELAKPRIICDVETPPDQPLSEWLALAVEEMVQQRETVLVAFRHEVHQLLVAHVGKSMGWSVRLVPNEPVVVH
jgi:hypothetical protein